MNEIMATMGIFEKEKDQAKVEKKKLKVKKKQSKFQKAQGDMIRKIEQINKDHQKMADNELHKSHNFLLHNSNELGNSSSNSDASGK